MPTKLQPEERLQVFVIRRLREILPADVDVWAIEQNSNLDTREEKQRIAAIRRWQRLLNKGCIPGVVDLHFSWPGSYGVMELKWGKNGLTGEERKFLQRRAEHGHKTAACWTAGDVENALREWGIELTGSMRGVDERLAIEAAVRKPARARKPMTVKPSRRALNAVARARGKGVFA